jgi:enoyl-CoA hydratase/carnithine racemase
MEEKFFHLSKDHEGICTYRINNPPVNALNFEQFKSLLNSIFKSTEDKSVKVVLLTGEGKTFMAGFDINAIAKVNSPRECFEKTVEVKELLSKLEYLQKPVIAAINGDCFGGGLELAMACHFRFAREKARFGFPEINIATIPTLGGTQRFPRLAGKAKAMELLMTGELINAKEALQIGFLNNVFSNEDFEESLQKIAKNIAKKSLPAIQAVLNSVIYGMDKSLGDAMVWESEISSKLMLTDDLKEGIAAFFERRKPIFKDQ